MDNTQFPIKKTKFLDLFVCSALFLFSFYISPYYSNVFLGIIILLSFGFIVHTIFVKSHSLSITEHILVAAGVGLLTTNVLMAGLVHLHKMQSFKEVLLLIFLFFTAVSFIKRKTGTFKGYHFNREDALPWILVIAFFFISAAVRHADFRFPDEYMYLNKFEDIIAGGQYISTYAQDRYFFHYSYSAILEFAPLTFKSTEIISLFFVLMTLIPTYLLGKELFDKKVGYLAAVFLAFNPSFIFYSIRLLTWVPSIFLITSFLYFFYKWHRGRNPINFLISGIFITIAIFIKLHGIVFLAIALAYMFLASNIEGLKRSKKHLLVLISALILFSNNWNLHRRLWDLLSDIVHDVRNDIIGVGYKMYITYFSPDIYTMAFVFIFFVGVAAILREPRQKKLLLLIPIVIYASLLSSSTLSFGVGIRQFLIVVPLMSITVAYGIVHREKVSRGVFWALSYSYLAVLAIMAIYAPKFPHLDHVLPDIPLWIRILTFSAAFVVVFLMIQKREKWQNVEYAVISLVIISSFLNANFFINMQEGYPDDSKNGIVEAGTWLSENTPPNAVIQSSTWELRGWMNLNKRSNPEMLYPKSTFLSYYVDRTTYAPPRSEDLFLKRIGSKEVDYIVIFTDPLLTTSDRTKEIYKYLQKFVDEPPPGTELAYTGYNENRDVWFRVYKVI